LHHPMDKEVGNPAEHQRGRENEAEQMRLLSCWEDRKRGKKNTKDVLVLSAESTGAEAKSMSRATNQEERKAAF